MEHKKFLIFLFLCSLLLRVLFFLYFTQHGTNAWIYVDSEQYDTIACNIAAGNGISLDGVQPQHYRLPGYPLFLAGCYKLFGERPAAALWVQLVLASIIPLLVFVLGLVLSGSLLLARIAAFVACIHPGLILYAGMLATESLTMLLLVLFFIFFFSQLQRNRAGSFANAQDDVPHSLTSFRADARNPGQQVYRLFFAGMFLGLASLVRPVGHYVLLLAYPSIHFSQGEKHSGRTDCFGIIFFFTGWLLPVAPWLVRNFLLTGALFFHSLPGLHFVQYLAAPIVLQRDHCSYPTARAAVLGEWEQCIVQREQMLGRPLDDYGRCRVGESLALAYVQRYPLYALKHAAIEMFKTCAGLYSAIILLADGVPWPVYEQASAWAKLKRFLLPNVRRPLLVLFIYAEILLHLLLLLGMGLLLLAALRHARARTLLLALAPFMLLFVGLTLAYGGARLRMPIEPLLIIGATYGWLWFFDCV